MSPRPVPELLAPAGSLEAVRAAVANGADAVYLGAERFNARDEGAQLTMDEVEEACRLAHERGRRIYLTLNTLLKPAELADALELLDDAIDRGIDAAIVQDVGLVRLIQRVHPAFELHGSTQMTVHDASGAAVTHQLGLRRVVVARENTLEDIRAIHDAVPELGLESFVHGALCISYSGQCYMSGMISERSANRGSCAQSCRKEYRLTDSATGAEIDAGFLISARDLAAHEHLEAIANAGVGCLKVEGRKKKPEYVATATRSYRTMLEALARGEPATASPEAVGDLVQIYSRGFTGGMYGGRAGRDYVTRDHPDNRGLELGAVVGHERGEIIIEVSQAVEVGDGLGFEPPAGAVPAQSTGFTISAVRTLGAAGDSVRQAVAARVAVPVGWRVVRTTHAALLERARASYADLAQPVRSRKTRLDARVAGSAGTALRVVFAADAESVSEGSEIPLSPARTRSLDEAQLREQLGRLGETPFALGALDVTGLAPGLFLPVSELNGIRQRAVEQLLLRRDWAREALRAGRRDAIRDAISAFGIGGPAPTPADSGALSVDVYRIEDARAAAAAGATEICFDPFLRHPAPPLSRVKGLAEEMAACGVMLRIRTPTIVRPAERRSIQKWLDLDLPVMSGHLGLVAELAGAGRDVVADYAVNCFNQHSAAEYFRLGARRITLSVELTVEEMAAVTAPWSGRDFDVVVYGRPEGMTIEHCVLSAAYGREPTTCRDLCVQRHPVVSITDPAGYTFPVATDAACRNRLLHSRPIDGSEYLPALWRAGLRSVRLLFNVPDEPVAELVAAWRAALDAMPAAQTPPTAHIRPLLGGEFTRGHFARAV